MAGSPTAGRPEATGAEEATVREVLSVLARRRRTVIAFALLVFLVALACSLLQTSVYTAEARVLIEQRESQQVLSGTNQPLVVDRKRIIDTEVRIIASEEVRRRVVARFGPGTPEPVVTAVEGTDLVALKVASTDPALAAAVANATAEAYIAYRYESTQADLLGAAAVLQRQLDDLATQIKSLDAISRSTQGAEQSAAILAQAAANTRYGSLKQQADSLRLQAAVSGRNATLVDRAEVPDARTSPSPLRSAVLALVVGAIFGTVLAYVVEFFDDRIETQSSLEQLLPDVPVLGIVPVFASWPARTDTHIASVEEPDGSVAEAYRSMRVALQFVDSERHYRVLQVTSSSQGEGKSATAVNLAVMFALIDQSVILIDADMRRPRLHRFLGTPNGVGLSTALLKGARLDEVAQDVLQGSIRFVPSGPTPSFPAELLQSSAAENFFAQCRDAADVVIVDSPPVLPVADPLALSTQADAVLLVVSAQRSQRRNVQRATSLLGTVAANVAGVVLNEASPGASGADRYANYTPEDLTTRRRVEKLFRPDVPA